ncbi:MAG TPA: glycosyltransferase family 2 protein [Patescibacteria group bacterium]|jgi:glycosyltransferase involved in cell wall biosynthesis|nr:glycosyltransferase family 2 protein [Patescibacteria group bacterium]
MSSQSVSIGIVIPAYNEGPVIGEVLSKIPRTIAGHSVKIVVINDGSKDNTAAEVAKHKDVLLINHLLNSGVGAATRTGLTYAENIGFDLVATYDGDGQHHPKDLVKVVEAALDNKADIVIGSRLADLEGMPWYKTIGNFGLSTITYIIFGSFVLDSQSGLKAFNKSALHSVRFKSNDYSFCSEIIWRAKQQKLSITEIPIRAIYTGYSTSKANRQLKINGFNLIGQMLKRRLIGLINE